MGRLRAGLDRLGAGSSAPGFTPAQRWLLLLLTLAAALIRLSYQFDREFRGDEVGTLIHMDRSIRYLLTHCETWLTMNHFIVAEKLMGDCFGRGPLALGMLPLVAGVSLVPLIACLARRFTEARVALLAAVLVALNPFLIDYSGRIRSYSLLASAALLLLLTFLNWYRRPSSWRGAQTALAAVVLLLVHPLGLYPFLLVPIVLVLDRLAPPSRAGARGALRSLLLPLLLGLLAVAAAYSGLFRPLAEEGARWHAGVITSFEYLPFLMNGYFGGGPLVWVFGFFIVVGAVSAWRRRSGFALLLFGLVLPSLVLSAQGLAHRPWAYQRMLIFQLPVLLLLVAEGVCALAGARRGLAARRKTRWCTDGVIVVESQAHRTRRIGGYGKFCGTPRSAARARLGVAWFFDGLLAGVLVSLLLLAWAPGLERLFEQKARLTGSPLLEAARFVEARFEPGDVVVADRRLDLLHLQNHLSPERYPARTMEQFLSRPAHRRGRFFFWSKTRLRSRNPRQETEGGSMILYSGAPPTGSLHQLRADLLATVAGQPPGEAFADCYGLLCRLEKPPGAPPERDFCGLWRRHRVVTRRERIGRIGALFH